MVVIVNTIWYRIQSNLRFDCIEHIPAEKSLSHFGNLCMKISEIFAWAKLLSQLGLSKNRWNEVHLESKYNYDKNYSNLKRRKDFTNLEKLQSGPAIASDTYRRELYWCFFRVAITHYCKYYNNFCLLLSTNKLISLRIPTSNPLFCVNLFNADFK